MISPCEFLELLLDFSFKTRSLVCTPMIFLDILFKEDIYYMNHVFWYSNDFILHDMISLYLWLAWLKMFWYNACNDEIFIKLK